MSLLGRFCETTASAVPSRRGITEVPGLYVLGLPLLSRRAVSFIFGVEQDAARLAEHIAARA
jgi:putative flavoprotein involved in K+ transport